MRFPKGLKEYSVVQNVWQTLHFLTERSKALLSHGKDSTMLFQLAHQLIRVKYNISMSRTSKPIVK